MFRSVFSKTLYDRRWFVFGWAFGLSFMFGLTAILYPSIKDSIGSIFQSVPPALHNLLGEVSSYGTYEGYMASAVYGLRAEILAVPLAVVLGLAVGVNEERSRRLYQLLAQPVSRVGIALQKWLAGVVIIALIIALSLGVMCLASLAIHETIPLMLLLKINGMLTLLTVTIFTISFGLGMGLGYRGPAMFVPVAWAVLSFIVQAFGALVDWLDTLSPYSILTYFKTSDYVTDAVDVKSIIFLGGCTLVFLVIALVGFSRRDIREEA